MDLLKIKKSEYVDESSSFYLARLGKRISRIHKFDPRLRPDFAISSSRSPDKVST